MKLLRFGPIGQEKPGIQTADGKNLDCSSFGEDWDESFFLKMKVCTGSVSGSVKTKVDFPKFRKNARLGSPIARPSKIICIGLNYRMHAEEAGMPVPEVPIIFMKATSSLCGPYDPIFIPKNSTQTDWEVELAVIIGKKSQVCIYRRRHGLCGRICHTQ